MSGMNYIIRVASTAKPVIPRTGDVVDGQRRTALAIDVLGNGSMIAVGLIVGYPVGLNAPPGWLLCDGSLVARRAYPALFKLVGSTYGDGDGTTTFALPDFRGAAPVPEATPPAQTIVNGAVATGDTSTGDIGNTGGNIVTGGRPIRDGGKVNLP